ncbi:MAG: hypothetical protein V2A77_04960 [Pseudomonadota bacterium]
MKKVALLLDGGFLGRQLKEKLHGRWPNAEEIVSFAKSCLISGDVETEARRL